MAAALDIRIRWLLLVSILGAVFYWFGSALTPFIVAGLFAYLFNPLVEKLERHKIGRSLGVSLLFLVLTLALVGIVLVLVPFMQKQVTRFIEQLPNWIAWARNVAAPWLEQRFGFSFEMFDSEGVVTLLQNHWREAGGLAGTLVAKVSKSGFAVVAWLLNLVIVPVAAFYLLRDWNLLVERIHALLPRHIEPVVVRLVRESDETLGAFLRGQLSVMIILGVLYGVGLWAVGISVGPLIGMIAGLISFVPYLGAIVGVAMGVIAALVQYQDAFHVAMVLIVFASGQLLEGYVLVPKLVGDRIGLHPVAVMFAILAGGELFGFVGVLVALPLAAVIMVLLRYAYQRYTQSEMYQEPPTDSAIVLEGSIADSVRVAKGEAESTPKAAPAPAEPDKPA